MKLTEQFPVPSQLWNSSVISGKIETAEKMQCLGGKRLESVWWSQSLSCFVEMQQALCWSNFSAAQHQHPATRLMRNSNSFSPAPKCPHCSHCHPWTGSRDSSGPKANILASDLPHTALVHTQSCYWSNGTAPVSVSTIIYQTTLITNCSCGSLYSYMDSYLAN